MNTQKLILALFHAESALDAAFRLRRGDSERFAAKILVHRVRNLRASLSAANHAQRELMAA